MDRILVSIITWQDVCSSESVPTATYVHYAASLQVRQIRGIDLKGGCQSLIFLDVKNINRCWPGNAKSPTPALFNSCNLVGCLGDLHPWTKSMRNSLWSPNPGLRWSIKLLLTQQMTHGSTVNWNTVQLTYKTVPYEWMNNVQIVWDSPISGAIIGTWSVLSKFKTDQQIGGYWSK